MLNLRALRELRGKMQKEVANDLGIGLSTLSQYETGKREPDIKTLIKIADYFDCSADYLLGRVDYPELVIKKAPPESGADVGNYAVNKGAPEFTAEEILRLKEFLQNQGNSSGE